MNSGRKIISIFLFLIIFGIGSGLDVAHASNPASGIAEITGTRQLVFNNESTLSVKLGLTYNTLFSTASFTFSNIPSGVVIESCALNPDLSDYYSLKRNNNVITLTSKNLSSQPSSEDYLFQVTFDFDGVWGMTLENEITVDAVLTEADQTYKTTPFILNVISKNLLGDVDLAESGVNEKDFEVLRDFILRKNTDGISLGRADLDSNGRINIADLYMILLILIDKGLIY